MEGLIYDLETNGLLDTVTKIHCVNTLDRETGTRSRYHDDLSVTPRAGSLIEGLLLVTQAHVLCGVNIIRYDNPVIVKLYPHLPWREGQRVVDSMVSARVIWTNMADIDFAKLRRGHLPPEFQKKGLVGRHSLEAWGYRLGDYKGDFDPKNYTNPETGKPHTWQTIPFSQDMSDYGDQDCVVTEKLQLLIESKNYSQECLDLEHAVATIVAKQERDGFAFDEAAAQKLYAKLQARRVELEGSLTTVFPPWSVIDKVFVPKRDDKKRGYIKGEPVTKYKTVIFNPGSRDHIADRLKALYGWKPEDFTDNGKPKVDETILDSLPYAEAKPLAEYMMLVKRLGQIGDGKEGWLKAVRNGRIHGGVNTNGAVTGRMTHMGPNIAQTPRCGTPYGAECRALFIAPEGRVLVGCDAEGIELRMLAHYMARYDDGAYAITVSEGRKEDGTDVHTVNMTAIGLRLRDSAKTFVYALIYGAGDFKLGSIVYHDFTDETKARFDAKFGNGPRRQKKMVVLGKERRASLMANLPALARLVADVKAAAKSKGHLRGLDGRLLHVRSEHGALNTLLQSGGAVVMKRGLVILNTNADARALVCDFTANVHDEWQIETEPTHADLLGPIAADAIRLAGESFNLRCPLSGSFSVGKTWADTH